MASRRYAVGARFPAVGAHRATFPSERLRRPLSVARAVLGWVPFLLILWVALSVFVARGEALSGVHVGAVDVGGMNAVEAHAAVDRHYDHLLAQPVEIVVEGRTWNPTATELGFAVHPDGAIDRAMTYGRDRETFEGVLRAMGMPEHEVAMPVAVAVDEEKFDAVIDRIEAELGDGPVDAAVTIDGERIDIVEAAAGQGIDRDVVRHQLAHQLVASRGVSLDIARTPQEPRISTDEAVRANAAVERLSAEPFVLTAGEDTWELAPATILTMIEVVPDASEPGMLVVAVREDAVAGVVDQVAEEIDRNERAARVDPLATHSKLIPSRDGRTVDRDALAEEISRAVQAEQRVIAVPHAITEANVTTESLMREMGITDVIASGDSVYVGSGTGRAHNVELAARMIDGTLVEPGGEFSFNDAVGSLFTGEYLEAGSYIDGPNGQSLAGGVCQVSTTVFRAALVAGFPVTEWWPHSYRSPFYELGGWEPGWDASIVQDGNVPEASTDFRFVNPTDSWLLIRSSVTAGDELTVEIHGAPTGYDVWFDEPEIETVAWASDTVTVSVDPELPPGTILPDQPKMDGLRVSVVRYVTDADGETVSVDTFVSTYGAYGAIRRASPDMEAAAWNQ